MKIWMYDVYREVVITTKWTKLKKRVAVRRKKLLELTKLVGVFRDIEDVQGALQDLEVLHWMKWYPILDWIKVNMINVSQIWQNERNKLREEWKHCRKFNPVKDEHQFMKKYLFLYRARLSLAIMESIWQMWKACCKNTPSWRKK